MAKPVPPLSFLDHYELIGHFIGADGVNTWRNSIVIKDSTGVPSDITDPIPQMCDFWRRNLITVCKLDHIELRLWARGAQPYSLASALWESTANCGLGTKSSGGAYSAEGTEGVGKEVAGFVRLVTAPGKNGHMFLRALLDESDVAAQAGGQWVPITPGTPNVTPTKFQAIVTATILPFLITDPGLCVVHFSVKQYNAHPGVALYLPFSTGITSMVYEGPTVVKSSHKSAR